MRSVKITKLETYTENPFGMIDSYWAIGGLPEEPEIGKTLLIHRTANIKGVSPGYFQTSTIKNIEYQEDGKLIIFTENSKFLLEDWVEETPVST